MRRREFVSTGYDWTGFTEAWQWGPWSGPDGAISRYGWVRVRCWRSAESQVSFHEPLPICELTPWQLAGFALYDWLMAQAKSLGPNDISAADWMELVGH